MRAFYREYLQIPLHGKIKDKVMSARVILTATIIAACLICMSLTAYAYFSYSVSSGVNTLVSAHFDAGVTVKKDGNEVTLGVGRTPKELTASSLSAGEYTVEMTHGGTASTGFCVITVTVGRKENVYHTHQLWKVEESGHPHSMTVTLTLPEGASLSVYSHWGTSSHYALYALGESSPFYLHHGAEVEISPYIPPMYSPKPPSMTTEEPKDTIEEELPDVYIVESGDNLSKIAKKYGISYQRLMAYNGLTSDVIYAGQELAIPPEDWQMPPATQETKNENTETEPNETTGG